MDQVTGGHIHFEQHSFFGGMALYCVLVCLKKLLLTPEVFSLRFHVP